jgi:hypothetical protein
LVNEPYAGRENVDLVRWIVGEFWVGSHTREPSGFNIAPVAALKK